MASVCVEAGLQQVLGEAAAAAAAAAAAVLGLGWLVMPIPAFSMTR